MIEDAPEENEISVQGKETQYVMTAGYPKTDRTFDPSLAAPKRITFRAEKEGYLDSDLVTDPVIVIGDVAVGRRSISPTAQFVHKETRWWNRVIQLCYNKLVQATKARVGLGVLSTRLVGWAWECVVCSLVNPKRFIPEGTPFVSVPSYKHPYA